MNKRRKSESKSTAASRFSVYLFELCIWIIRLFGEGDITVFVLSLALVLEKHRVSQRLDDCCIFIRWLFYCCFRLKWYRWRRERKTHCWLLFGGCCYASFLASYPNHSTFFSLQCLVLLLLFDVSSYDSRTLCMPKERVVTSHRFFGSLHWIFIFIYLRFIDIIIYAFILVIRLQLNTIHKDNKPNVWNKCFFIMFDEANTNIIHIYWWFRDAINVNGYSLSGFQFFPPMIENIQITFDAFEYPNRNWIFFIRIELRWKNGFSIKYIWMRVEQFKRSFMIQSHDDFDLLFRVWMLVSFRVCSTCFCRFEIKQTFRLIHSTAVSNNSMRCLA